jgi:predicted membrane-bound spermidine synthase
MKILRPLLGLYAAASGFILMVFELSAARLLAPTIGSSMYVWTSVIGIIVLALSVGFWCGGRLADQRNRSTDVIVLFGLIGVAIAPYLAKFNVSLPHNLT